MDEPPRVLLNVQHKGNAKILGEFLKERYSLVEFKGSSEELTNTDLVIADDRGLNDIMEELLEAKQKIGKIYLPVLLLTSRKTADHKVKEIWKVIDDQVIMPVDKDELLVRINALLRIRSQSLELKRLNEKLLEESRKQIKLLSRSVEQSPISIQITDPNANIEYVNPAFEKISGYSKEELIGQNPRIVQSGKHTKEFYKKMWETILSGKDWHGEISNKKKSGELYWEQDIITPIIDEEGNISHFVALKEDITEKKKMLEDLKHNEEELKAYSEFQKVLMNISTRYIDIPLQHLDEVINSALREIGEFVEADRVGVFDYDFQRQISKNTYEWCREGVEPQIKNLQAVPLSEIPYWVDAHMKGELIYVPDVFTLPDDGLRVILEPQKIKSLITAPMMHKGKCIGFVGFGTIRHHHTYSDREKKLLKVFAQILVNIQMRDLAEKDLIKAKEKAEESDRLKTAFLANMSHEIRTPMNGILGFTDILRNSDFTSEEKDDYIEIIHKSGQRLMNTVNDIVVISKIEAGVVTVDWAETNLNNSLQEMMQFFGPEAQKKGLEIKLDQLLPEHQSTIITDKNKFEAILSNLIKNAIKYTDKGKINVGATIKNKWVEFYVKDNGIGVPKHRHKAIFNRFEQADISDTRAFQGSGLGLAISKSYIEMLGGEIWLESEENKGSVFYFTLPVKKIEEAKQEEPPNEANENSYQSKIETPGKKLKVLIAEDDEDSFVFLKTILRKYNWNIIHTETGRETIEKFREQPDFDLILMDIKLPDLDGFEATRQIKEINPSVPIIAQTAYAMEGDRQKALEAGCDEYISKPIKKAQLLEKIQNVMAS